MSKAWWAVIGLTLARFIVCIDFTIVNTAIPYLQQELNAPLSLLMWVMTAFFLAQATTMTLMGRLGDAWGHRRLFYVGLLAFAATSVLAGAAPNVWVLIIARLLQGFSAAMASPNSAVIVSHTLEGPRHGTAMGVYYGLGSLGLAVGPVAGSFILAFLSWRWIFYVNIPIALIVFLICIPTVRDYRSTDRIKVDWFGATTLFIGLASLILALSEGPNQGWDSFIFLVPMAITLLSAGLLVWRESKIDYSMLDFSLFHCRQFSLCQVVLAVLAMFYGLALFLAPLYLHLIRQEDILHLGFMLAVITATMAIGSVLFGHAISHFGPKWWIAGGLGVLTLAAVMQLFFSSDRSVGYVIAAFAVFGAGWASLRGPSHVAAVISVPKSKMGLALGTSFTILSIGAALGLAIGTSLFRWQAGEALETAAGGSAHWISRAVNNPDNAISLIGQSLSLSLNTARSLFESSFLQGYRAAIWFLIGATAACSFLAAVGLPRKQLTPPIHDEHDYL